MELSSPRTLFFVATLAFLAEVPALGQAPAGPDLRGPAGEAAAAALATRNLRADAALGRVGGLAATPAPPYVAPAKALDSLPIEWPFAPTIKPILEVPIQAIFLTDDDGGNPAAICAAEVNVWRHRANLIWFGSCLDFTFDASEGSSDYVWIRSTPLNSISDTSSPNWTVQLDLAKDLASQFPDKLVMLFRHGPDALPIGSGLAWTNMNFIVMPGFNATSICGVQNIGLMAHELGHFLGLPHTFTEAFASYADALDHYVVGCGCGLDDLFEGDGRDQTLPDPFIEAWDYQCNPATDALTFGDETFVLPRTNLMSHYYPTNKVVESQFYTARQVWALRSGLAAHDAVLGGLKSIDVESLTPIVTSGWTTDQPMTQFLGKWSGDQQLLWLDGALGETLRVKFSADAGGNFDVYAGFTAAPDYATIQTRVNGELGSEIELYSSIVLPTGPVFLGSFELPRGDSILELTLVENDPRVLFARQGVGLDYILLADPCAKNQEVVRLGIPQNLNAFKIGALGGPIVGTTWLPHVDHSNFVIDATVDVMVLSSAKANLYFGLGCTLLVDLNASLGIYTTAPGANFAFSIPMDPSYVGAWIFTQAGSFSAGGYFKLTNALDVKIGSF